VLRLQGDGMARYGQHGVEAAEALPDLAQDQQRGDRDILLRAKAIAQLRGLGMTAREQMAVKFLQVLHLC
jgi:hypothetical protein